VPQAKKPQLASVPTTPAAPAEGLKAIATVMRPCPIPTPPSWICATRWFPPTVIDQP
jgi:hypothetical protein